MVGALGGGGLKKNTKVAKAGRWRKRDRKLFEQSAVRELSPLSRSGEVQERGPVVSPSLAPKSEINTHTVIFIVKTSLNLCIHLIISRNDVHVAPVRQPVLPMDTLMNFHPPPPSPPPLGVRGRIFWHGTAAKRAWRDFGIHEL